MSAPLVLLHPLGVDHRFWDPLRAALGPDLGPVVAPDLLGHGAAPLPPWDAGVEAYADAVEDALAGSGPVQLVGVSLGGLVAQVLAARDPDLVERLVLVDTVAVYPEAMREMWRARAVDVRAHGLEPVVAPMEALWFTDAFRRDHPDHVVAVRELLLAGDAEGYARTCEVLALADTTALAGSITAPTLVVCGVEDAPPFREAASWLAGTIPGARLAWLDGAHAAAYERAGDLADLLR